MKDRERERVKEGVKRRDTEGKEKKKVRDKERVREKTRKEGE